MILKINNTIDTHLQKCFGLNVSDAWRGEGKTIFLELDILHHLKKSEKRISKGQGEVTIMFDCRWRLETLNAISVGSLDETAKIEEQIKLLIGKSIKSIFFVGRIPEIVIEFDNKRWLQSFTSYKYEDWSIMFRNTGSISRSKRDVVYKEL
jgi:hypothetical protein